MRKVTSLLIGAALMLIAGSAWAIPTTWTDTRNFGDPGIHIPPTYFFTHDISDGVDGFKSFFMGGNDTISSYILSINLNDGIGTNRCYSNNFSLSDGTAAARILTTGGVYSYDFSLSSNDFSGNILGRLDLWADGRLGVFVSACYGDFYLASSTLTVNGDNGSAAPVPEPGTMVLLGFGLFSLAVFGKRRLNKDA